MSDQSGYSDADLTAYLDAELSKDHAASLGRALAVDPVLAARLHDLRLSKADLRAGFALLLNAAPPMPDLSMPDLSIPRAVRSVTGPASRWGGLVAAMAVCAVLGAGFWATRPQPRDWMDFVAAYQRLYVAATLADIRPGEAEVTAQLADLSKRIGLDLAGVHDGNGLVFRRGQVLGYDGALLVQLAFQTADGTPVALCILRSATQSAQPLVAGRHEGLQSVAWAREGYGFFLIGGTDPNSLIAAAQRFAAAI